MSERFCLGASCNPVEAGFSHTQNQTFKQYETQTAPPAAQTPIRAELIRRASLTWRQVEALDLLAKFLTNKEIAGHLGISLPASKKLLRSAYLKLGVQSRAEAIARWREAKPWKTQ